MLNAGIIDDRIMMEDGLIQTVDEKDGLRNAERAAEQVLDRARIIPRWNGRGDRLRFEAMAARFGMMKGMSQLIRNAHLWGKVPHDVLIEGQTNAFAVQSGLGPAWKSTSMNNDPNS